MTNWEHLFGTPERAIHTETEFHSWPFFIAVYETSRMSSCTTSKRPLASFCEGWENARGCRVERAAAVAYDLEIIGHDIPCTGGAR